MSNFTSVRTFSTGASRFALFDFDVGNDAYTVPKSGIGCPLWSYSAGFNNTGVISVGY